MGASKDAGTGSAKVRTLHIGGREACRSPHESPASPPAAGPPPASSLRADPPLSWTALANTSRPNHSAAALVLRASRILCHPGAVCARNRLGRATRRLVFGGEFEKCEALRFSHPVPIMFTIQFISKFMQTGGKHTLQRPKTKQVDQRSTAGGPSERNFKL